MRGVPKSSVVRHVRIGFVLDPCSDGSQHALLERLFRASFNPGYPDKSGNPGLRCDSLSGKIAAAQLGVADASSEPKRTIYAQQKCKQRLSRFHQPTATPWAGLIVVAAGGVVPPNLAVVDEERTGRYADLDPVMITRAAPFHDGHAVVQALEMDPVAATDISQETR